VAIVSANMHCPVAQVYFYLIKCGVKRAEVDKVVQRSFARMQVAQVKPARYNKTTKLAYVMISEEDGYCNGCLAGRWVY